jgi:flavoprotein
MINIKIYKKIGNSVRRDLHYKGFNYCYELFLKNQAENVFKYPNLESILSSNINKIFLDEVDTEYKDNYSSVLAYGDVQSGKTANMICSIF